MSKSRKFVKYWLPVLMWMILIFTASADRKSYQHSSIMFEPLMRWLFPHMPPEQLEAIHHVFRKCAHLTEYAILALLFWRAVRQPEKILVPPWVWPEAGLALALVFVYSASDELHQVFVPNRTGQVSDVMVDCSGGALGLTILWLAGKVRQRW